MLLKDIRSYNVRRTGHKAEEGRGELAIIEGGQDISFDIKRVFYIYGNDNMERGGHRHHKTIQALICLHGSFEIYVNDGKSEKKVSLDSKTKCLILDPSEWHTMKASSVDSVLLVLASEHYDQSDYIDEPYP